MSQNKIDPVGEKYGHWTVLHEVKPRKGVRYFMCKCVCGTKKDVAMSSLRSGNSTSCGCQSKGRLIDLTGRRFGRLTVIKLSNSRNKDGRVKWHCKCDCGNFTEVLGDYLKVGDTNSCGCLKSEIDELNLRKKYDAKRVDGVVMTLFKGKEPRKDSTTGYRGVSRYYTRVSKEERFRAWITVKGKRYYKSGFKTAEEAYYYGRLALEEKHLPKNPEK